MKHYMKFLAGLGSLAILMQNGAAFPAMPRITAQAARTESMQLRIFTYDFGSFQALYDTVSKKWYDTKGNALTPESDHEQAARFNGQDVTVNLETGKVVDSRGGELPALSQCVSDYLGRSEEWISYAPQYYDKAQQKYVDVPKPERFPLSYRFVKDSDKFACDLYFGDQHYCTLAYQQQGYASDIGVLGDRTTAQSLPFTDVGDTTIDGEVNVCDAVLTCRTVGDEVGVPITELGRDLADENGDGRVDPEDTMDLMCRLANIDPVARRYPDCIDAYAEVFSQDTAGLDYEAMSQKAEASGEALRNGAAYSGEFSKSAVTTEAGSYDAITYYYRAPADVAAGQYCILRGAFNPNNRTVTLTVGRREDEAADRQPDTAMFRLLFPQGKYDFSGWRFLLEPEDMSPEAIAENIPAHNVPFTKPGAEIISNYTAKILKFKQEDLAEDSFLLPMYGGMLDNGGEFELFDLKNNDDTDMLTLSYVNAGSTNESIWISRIEMDAYGTLLVHASKLNHGGDPNSGAHMAIFTLEKGALPEPTGVRYIFDGGDALMEPEAISVAIQRGEGELAVLARASESNIVQNDAVRQELESRSGDSIMTYYCDSRTKPQDPALASLQSQLRDSASVYVLHGCTMHYAITGAEMDHFNKTLTLTVGKCDDQTGMNSIEPIFTRLTIDWAQSELRESDVQIVLKQNDYGTDWAAFEAAAKNYVYIENAKQLASGVSTREIPCRIMTASGISDPEHIPAPGDIYPENPAVWQVRNANEYKAYCKAYKIEESDEMLKELETKDFIFITVNDHPCEKEIPSGLRVSYDGTLSMSFAQWFHDGVDYTIGMQKTYTIETAKGAMPTVGRVRVSYHGYTEEQTKEYGPEHMRFVLENWRTLDSVTYSEPVVPREWLIEDTAVESTQMWYESDALSATDAPDTPQGYVLTDSAEIEAQLAKCGESGKWDTENCDMLVLSVAGLNSGIIPAVQSAEIDGSTGTLNVGLLTYLPEELAKNQLCTVNLCLLIEKGKLPEFTNVKFTQKEVLTAYEAYAAQVTRLTVSATPNHSSES